MQKWHWFDISVFAGLLLATLAYSLFRMITAKK